MKEVCHIESFNEPTAVPYNFNGVILNLHYLAPKHYAINYK